MNLTYTLLVALMIPAMVLIWILIARKDEKRIANYISENGGNILHSKWTPFESQMKKRIAERLYQVRFLDRNCHEHLATFKSGGEHGVFIAHDEIVRRSRRWDPDDPTGKNSKKPQKAADGFGSYLTLRMRYKPKTGKAGKSNSRQGAGSAQ